MYFRKNVSKIFWIALKKDPLETPSRNVQRPLLAPCPYTFAYFGAVHMLLLKPLSLSRTPSGVSCPGGRQKLTACLWKEMSEGRFPGDTWSISELPFCRGKGCKKHVRSQNC